MPHIGEIQLGVDIGYKTVGARYQWHACIFCGKERWVKLLYGKLERERCMDCAKKSLRREGNPKWKGGKRHNPNNGYIGIHLLPSDFFYPMADKNGWVFEHRLLMAQKMKRCLLPWEVVHHKNGQKNDNRIENLQLLPHGRYHLTDMVLKRDVLALRKRNAELEAENSQLRQTLSLPPH